MFQPNISLKDYSNYKIGGSARHFSNPKNTEEIEEVIKRARKEKLPIFILGGGTNLLIDDGGYKGLVIKPDISVLKNDGEEITVGAGILVSDLLDFTISKGLSALEWAGGLPGTVGGAIRGNAGAFGGETKDAVKEVVSLDISGKKPRIIRRSGKDLRFSYRSSVYKINDGKEIIIEAVLNLKKGSKRSIREGIESKIKYRLERHPMDYPNIGSIFKNVDLKNVPANVQRQFADRVKNDPFPVLPTAVLIADTGLKGVAFGGAMISPKHPNFIVNVLDARAEDVKTLIEAVKAAVKEKFDIKLEEEIIYVK